MMTKSGRQTPGLKPVKTAQMYSPLRMNDTV